MTTTLPNPDKRWRTRRPAKAKSYRWVGDKRWHVLRAERALGKPLPAGAVVHHADGSKADDAPLVICQDSAYHQFLHRLLRIKLAGGDPWRQRICGTCKQLVALEQMTRNRNRYDGIGQRCRSCNSRLTSAPFRKPRRAVA